MLREGAEGIEEALGGTTLTQLESQLQSSITYRRLVNDIEAIAQRAVGINNYAPEVKFSPEAKAEMVHMIADVVGQAVKDFVYRCGSCDSDRIYLQCVACRETTKVGGA